MSQYGKFHDACRDAGSRFATIPVCNLFEESQARGGSSPWFDGCNLEGIHLNNDRYLANLGTCTILNGTLAKKSMCSWSHRVYTSRWSCDTGLPLPIMEIRPEKGSCWAKVCRRQSLRLIEDADTDNRTEKCRYSSSDTS